MRDGDKIEEQLADELTLMRQRIADLEATEAKYRALVDKANEIIVVIQDDVSKFSNPKASEITGYSQEELTSRPFVEFIHPDDRAIALENYSRRLSGDKSTPVAPVRILDKRGNIKWIEFSWSALPWEGKPALLYLINDVTEWKKMEVALGESEAKYRELAESITDVFFALDENLRYTYWNKASEELTGVPAKDALGKHLYNIFPDDEATRRAEEAYRRTLATRKPQHFINNFPIGGKDYVFEISTYPTKGGLCVHVRDITERKKLEEALSESEQWYRHVFDNAPFGIGFSSIDGKVINQNKAMETITGYSVEELTKINLTNTYVNIEDREALLKELRRRGSLIDYPVQLRRKDGTPYDALLSVRLTTIGDKEFVQTICHDITERKRAEEALRESEERYRSLVELSPEAIFVSIDGKHVFVNTAGLKLFGATSPDQIIGKPVMEVIHPDYREIVAKRVREALETWMAPPTMEEKFLRLDGTEIDVEVRAAPLIYEGKPAMQAIVRDVSERKHAETALRESEEKYRTLFESSGEGIIVTGPDGRLLSVNPAVVEMLGYKKKEEIVGLPSIEVYMNPEQRSELFKQLDKHGFVQDYELTLKKKDGTPVYILGSATIYKDRQGNLLRTEGIFTDITERKKAEETLRLSEQNFRDSIENSPLGVRIVNEGGKSLYANRAFLDIYGYNSLDELEAVPRRKRYTTDSYHEHDNRIKKRNQGEYVPSNYEISIVRSDGQIRHLAVSRGEVLWNGKRQFQVLYQDITEHKAREEEYQAIIRATIEGFWQADMQGHFLDVNEAYCQLTGYNRDELLNMSISDIEAKETSNEIAQRIRKIKDVGHDRFETRHRRKDGKIVDVEISVNYLPIDSGRMIVFIRDITERKRVEEQLQQEKDSAQRYLDIAGVMLVANDAEGRVSLINRKGCQVLGYEQEEIIGKNWFDILIPESVRREVKAVFNKLMAGEVEPAAYFENPILTRNGEERIIAWHNVILKDGAGNSIGTLSSGEDITERRQGEEALRASEERYRLLAENVRDVIWATDMDFRFTYVSPSVKYLGDRTAEEVMSMSIGELLTPSSQKVAMKTFAEELVMANTTPQDPTRSRTLEVEFLRRDGSTLWAELKMNFIRGPGGRPVGILGVMRDISERKQAEEERRALEQKAQLASRLASVGELAAGVAHEINNPLTGVIGYAELLMEEDVPEHIRSDLEIIHDGARRVADIVKGLLRFARQTKPERTVVDINEIIEVCLRLRAYELDTSNIKVVTNLAPDLRSTIADAGQLQQVFLNLLINAEMEMKLAHGKGKLVVKTEHADNTIRVTFKDDGPGIAKENLEKIFDPFFTTREVGKGTGLGLSICHGIITEHGGRIWAESQSGKGATFIVELPVVTEKRRPIKRPKTTRRPKTAAKAKILVVDDEPVVRQLVSHILTEEGHQVDTTDDGKDALNRIKNNGYSLILLDVKLPGLSGSELYELIRNIAVSLEKRVVFITGDVMSADTEAFLTRTKAPFIAKPFNVRHLKSEIRRLLANSSPKRAAKSKKPKTKSKKLK